MGGFEENQTARAKVQWKHKCASFFCLAAYRAKLIDFIGKVASSLSRRQSSSD
jgi:hypothetical protein